MEECGNVLKQLIQSDLMNSEEDKTECPMFWMWMHFFNEKICDHLMFKLLIYNSLNITQKNRTQSNNWKHVF
jgi:hypothetical protein